MVFEIDIVILFERIFVEWRFWFLWEVSLSRKIWSDFFWASIQLKLRQNSPTFTSEILIPDRKRRILAERRPPAQGQQIFFMNVFSQKG